MEYFFLEIWRFEKRIPLSEKKPPLEDDKRFIILWLVFYKSLISLVVAKKTDVHSMHITHILKYISDFCVGHETRPVWNYTLYEFEFWIPTYLYEYIVRKEMEH